MQRTAGLKAIGMRGNTPHGMKTHRPAAHFGMPFASKIGPSLVQFKGLVEGHTRQFSRNRANASCGDANLFGNGLWGVCIAQIPLDHRVKDRAMCFSVLAQLAV